MTASPPFFFHRATPLGEGGVAVFELYGDGAMEVLRQIFRPKGHLLPEEGQARLGDLLGAIGQVIDEAVLCRAPASGTWSRLAAWILSVHGGLWIQETVSDR